MAFELNKKRYHDMDRNRTFNLISPLDIEIPIERGDYRYLSDDGAYLNSIKEFENEISSIYDDCDLKERFRKNLHVSLLPDYMNITDNYFLGFSPRDIIDNIFNILGIDKEYAGLRPIKYINIVQYRICADDVKSILKSHIRAYKESIAKLEYDEAYYNRIGDLGSFHIIELQLEPLKEKLKFAEASLNNIDYIFDLYDDRRLNRRKSYDGKDSHIIWRNLSYLLAVNSLREYFKTENPAYLQYPYKIYEKCTKKEQNETQMKWVPELYIDDLDADMQDRFDPQFYVFNCYCEKAFRNSPLAIEFLLDYKDNNFIRVFDTLKPDILTLTDNHFGEFLEYKCSKTRKTTTKGGELERLRAERQFASKLKFYSHDSEFSKHVICRLYSFDKVKTGYIGFILDNDYVVLDKFYTEYKDGTCEPARDAAVFALPLDLYIALEQDSGKIMKYRKQNPRDNRIEHRYHTENDSYTQKMLEVANRDSISKVKSSDYIKNSNKYIIDQSEYKKVLKRSKKDTNNKD